MAKIKQWIRLGSTLLPAIPPWETTILAQAGVRAGDEIRIALVWRGAEAGLLVTIDARQSQIDDEPLPEPADEPNETSDEPPTDPEESESG